MPKKIRRTIPPKIKKLLQKEINSLCPICKNEDVDHFEFHHIDENPSNNEFQNLLMLCPNCHSKITKKDFSISEVIEIKKKLRRVDSQIEFAGAIVDSLGTQWRKSRHHEFSFYTKEEFDISDSLKIDWGFINHTPRTILLLNLEYQAVRLPSGINGAPRPSVLKSLIEYLVPIKFDSNLHKVELVDQIQIPEKQAFKFKTLLYTDNKFSSYVPIDFRSYIDFKFNFSGNMSVNIPRIFLNCKPDITYM